MRRNHHAKNVGIIGILAYPKIKSKRKRANVASPSLLEGNGLRTAGEIIRGRVGS